MQIAYGSLLGRYEPSQITCGSVIGDYKPSHMASGSVIGRYKPSQIACGNAIRRHKPSQIASTLVAQELGAPQLLRTASWAGHNSSPEPPPLWASIARSQKGREFIKNLDTRPTPCDPVAKPLAPANPREYRVEASCGVMNPRYWRVAAAIMHLANGVWQRHPALQSLANTMSAYGPGVLCTGCFARPPGQRSGVRLRLSPTGWVHWSCFEERPGQALCYLWGSADVASASRIFGSSDLQP